MRASPRIDPTAELSADSLSSQQPFMLDHGELLDELTSSQSCFTPQEALAHICAMAMGRWSSAECLAELGSFLQTDQVVALGATEQNTPVFTSRATQELETLATDRVRRGADNTRHQIDERLVEARFDALERELSARLNAPVSLAQQRAAALHVASRTGDHAFVEGWAGAGKTTLLKALGEAYVEAGFKLVGCAQSAAAAQNLARETGIESRTIASLLLALRNGRAKLSERSVLLLDEAGMVGSREFAMLQDAAIAAGAKFVSVGDSKQLQPIAAGGIFRALVNIHGAAEISAIQRQRTDFGPLLDWLDRQAERGAGITPQQATAVRELPESERLAAAEAICQGSKKLRAAFERWRAKYDHEWLRLAVEQLAMGEALPALRLIDSRGRLMLLEGQESAWAAMVDAWSADKTPLASKAMIAGTRAEVAELNRRARERLVDASAVLDHAGAEIMIRHRDGATETKRFAAGDRIVFTQNDREIGVANGVAGTVKKIDKVRGDFSLVVELDAPNLHGDRRVVVPASFACFDLGYCLTNHKIQSKTYDAAYALASPMADREWIYVAASRSRFATTIFVDASMIGAADPESHLANREQLTREQQIEALARGMSRSHAKGTTLDYRDANGREPANHATNPTRAEQAKASAGASRDARPSASKSRRGQRGAQREKVSESDRRAATAFCEALSIGKQTIAMRQEPRR
ncbi:AAA family ATPase [Burkholderia sp. Ax-1724]|uniref:AAA family ATPase n=1 Tax=Burkholderia sp. Ax-1724 TaxID=2608336 RepID=UPI0031F5B163